MNNPETSEQVTLLENSISYSFHSKGLPLEALTHSSYSHENGLKYNYERLEFLGDAVLEMIISEHIIKSYPDFDEGTMSRLRAYVVNERFLSGIARDIGMPSYILLGKGELSSADGSDSILSDIFEAVVASVFLDGGYLEAKRLVIRFLENAIDESAANRSFLDEKGEVQKISQRYYNMLPVYTVLSETGPDHNKMFDVELTITGVLTVTGAGKSKKAAEKDAAVKALKDLSIRHP